MDKYELQGLLGAGGMGSVYRAYDHTLLREVAVKVVNLGESTQELRARFMREAQTAAGLEHNHIVRIYDYGISGDVNYVVMQYLTNGSLWDRMKAAEDEGRPRPDLHSVAEKLAAIASALDYAHARGVIHRDIKPQNIMFNNQGQPFLVDFGIAKLMTGETNLTGTGMALGTPSYMAPEQVQGTEITPAVDQYALAVTIYQLMAGRLPFEGDTPLQVMYKHVYDMPTPLSTMRPDIPPDLLLVMERAMAKKPEARFPNCTQFAQAFADAVVGAPRATAENRDYFLFKIDRPQFAPIPPPAPLTPREKAERNPSPTGTLPAPVVTPPPPARNILPLVLAVGAVVIVASGLALALLGSRMSESDLRLTEINVTLAALSSATPPVGVEILPSRTPLPSATPSATPTLSQEQMDAAHATVTMEARLTEAIENEQATLAAILTDFYHDNGTATARMLTPDVTATPTIDRSATRAARATQIAINMAATEAARPTATPTIDRSATRAVRATQIAINLAATEVARPTATPTIDRSATRAARATQIAINLAATEAARPTVTPTIDRSATRAARATQIAINLAATQEAAESAGGRIAFVSERNGNQDIYIINADGSGLRRMTDHEGSDLHPSWSPDGTQIVFASNRTGNYDIYIMLVDSGATRRVILNRANETMPVWSPDGSEIAFLSDRDGNMEIYVMTASGRNLRRLTDNVYNDHAPAWSPDGKSIVFRSSRDGVVEIYSIAVDTGRQRRLTLNTDYDGNPDWSPDGTQIAFDSVRGGGSDIYVMSASGRDVKRLTYNSSNEREPVWSPDGHALAMVSDRSGQRQIYLMDVDGKNHRLLTTGEDANYQPAWGPARTTP